jgi:hypothetical protein
MMQIINKLKEKFGARLLLPVLLVVLLILILTTTGAAQAFRPGDVDGNDKIDVRDVVLAQKYVLGKITLTEQQKKAALVKGYGEINAQDVTLIMQRAIGRITTFPLNITKVDDVAKTVTFGTTQANIGLPTTVSATLSDGTKRTVSVQWDAASTPAYNPNAYGSYVFQGNLVSLPTGITNPSAIKAKATVTIAFIPGPIPLTLDSVTVSGTPVVGGTLSAAVSPVGATANYQWQRTLLGGTFANIAGATSSSYIPVAGDVGYIIRVVATGIGSYSGTVTSNTIGPVVVATSLTAIGNITGETRVGQTLTAGALTPAGATATYQWQRATTSGGTYSNISGATSSTYVPVTGDIGYYLRVRATGSGAYTGSVDSNHVGPVLSATTYGVEIETSKTTPGVTFVSGAFTSGAVTPAPASAVYDTKENMLKVAGIDIKIKWSSDSNLGNYTITNISGSNKSATANVYVYADLSARNTAIALAAAINAVKTEPDYEGLLKATVAAVTDTVRITGIDESVPALTANLWKFEVVDTHDTGFNVAQVNKTIADQVGVPVPGAVYHVDSVKAVFKITVTNSATASGNLIVNVKDTSNAIDEDVSVSVDSGDSVSVVATKIKNALEGNTVVNANYVVTLSAADVTLTQKTGKAENIAVILK